VYEGRGYKYNPARNGFMPEFYKKAYELAHVGLHGKFDRFFFKKTTLP
jgi:hypothetical protein